MSLRAGIIGTGGIAGMGILGMHDETQIGEKKFEASHAGGYHANPDVDLVAVADVDEENLRRFGDAWDISSKRQYVGHEAMLGSENLDIVSVCTPTLYHHDHVLAAARSAADPAVIWCEKPIASSVTEASEMIDVCAETDTKLVINHSFRFVEKVQRLRELLDEGLLGDVRSITAQFRRELLRNSTHLLDTLLFLLDFEPTHAYGYLDDQNDAITSLEGDETVDDVGGGGTVLTADGTVAMLDCSIARDIASMNIQCIGTEGKVSLNNDDGEWRYWDLEDGSHVERQLPGIDGGWRWETDYRAAFPDAVDHIVALHEGEAANLSSGTEARRSLAIITGFYVSQYTGSRVSYPLDRPLQDVTISSW
jgi:predicted dehydrogenase